MTRIKQTLFNRNTALIQFLAITLWVSGCAHVPKTEKADLKLSSDTRHLSNVPIYAQKKYMCGPTSLAMVLSWTGETITPEQLESKVFMPDKKGSMRIDLITAARRHGKIAFVLEPSLSTLLQEVEQGHPVIILQNLSLKWFPIWHYAVVVGYDLNQNTIVLHSGDKTSQVLNLKTFQYTWSRGNKWALLVLPPGQMPATVNKESYLKATIGLEQTEQWEGAAKAYEAALRVWPKTLTAQLGLGNMFYKQGKLANSEMVLQEAAVDHPNSVIALNNYAQILAEQGKWQKALESSKKAVQLSDNQCEECLKTLQEIKNQFEKSS